MQSAQIISFRQKELLLIDNDGQPFVPMKPVVEGMGLTWASQTVKLNSNKARWGVSIIETPSAGGTQSYLCIPLRKLIGWLNTIHPNKVKPELRDNIIAYQNECDDALWAYWNDGVAVRASTESFSSILGQTIGTDGFHCLGAVLDGKLRQLPSKARQRAKMHVWSQVHKAFSVVSAQDIPADQLDSARNFIAAYVIEGEWLPKDADTQLDISKTGRQLLSFNHKGEQQIAQVPDDAYVLSQHAFLKGITHIPGDIPITAGDLFEFAIAAMNKLKGRSALQDKRLRELSAGQNSAQ